MAPMSSSPESLLQSRAAEFIEAFELLPDAEERMRYLITLGKNYPVMDEASKVDANLIPGCISRLWVQPEIRDGVCQFQMDADAMMPKGVAALLCRYYEGIPPQVVATTEPEFLEKCGLSNYLTPSRQSGLNGLKKFIRTFAQSHA